MALVELIRLHCSIKAPKKQKSAIARIESYSNIKFPSLADVMTPVIEGLSNEEQEAERVVKGSLLVANLIVDTIESQEDMQIVLAVCSSDKHKRTHVSYTALMPDDELEVKEFALKFDVFLADVGTHPTAKYEEARTRLKHLLTHLDAPMSELATSTFVELFVEYGDPTAMLGAVDTLNEFQVKYRLWFRDENDKFRLVRTTDTMSYRPLGQQVLKRLVLSEFAEKEGAAK